MDSMRTFPGRPGNSFRSRWSARVALRHGLLTTFVTCLGLSPSARGFRSVAAERRTSFNEGWRFFKGEAAGAEQPGFDDRPGARSNCRTTGPSKARSTASINPHTGGAAVLRRRLVPQDVHPVRRREGHSYFASSSTAPCRTRSVWLNGQDLGGRPYGYIGFAFDLTPHLRFGGKTMCWRCGSRPRTSPRAGIPARASTATCGYVTGPVHVAHWGTYVTTPEVSDAEGYGRDPDRVQNRRPAAAEVVLRDRDRRRSRQASRARSRTLQTIAAAESRQFDQPKLDWSRRRSAGTSTARTSTALVSDSAATASAFSTAT